MPPFDCLAIIMLPLDVSCTNWSGGWMPAPVDIDFAPETGMPTYVMLRDSEPPIRFSGEHKINISKDHDKSNPVGPWSAVNVFKTRGGKFICQESFKANRQEEIAFHCVEIFDDEQSAADFIRRSNLTIDGMIERLMKGGG